jgi:DNA replication protein DnaC
LVIDEVGHTLDRAQATLLFQVNCPRDEREQPNVLTSNKAFAECSEVFADDPTLASAALDRQLPRSTVIHMRSKREVPGRPF